MKRKLLLVTSLVIFSTFFVGCASFLNSKNQKVAVYTKSSDSEVFVDGKSQGKGSKVISKLERDRKVKQIKVVREGYKPVYKVHYQTSKSPLYILSWVPFGVLLYPPFCDVGPKSYDYKKTILIDEKPLVISERDDSEKYVYLKNTAFDVKKEDLKIKATKRKNLQKKNTRSKELVKSDEDIKFDNSIFSDRVEEILKKNNYIDTTNTVFKSKTNTLYITAKISKIEINDIYAQHALTVMEYVTATTDIEWEIFDTYDRSKFKKSFKASSGEFIVDNVAVNNSIEDAIQESFYNFMNTSQVKDLLKKENDEKVKYDLLTLKTNNTINTIEDAMSSTVTIKRKNGHGSGCVVSTDGYIVTNYHVVSGDGKITVVDKDGKENEAKLVRKNEGLDLALLKVSESFQKTYQLGQVKNYSVGDDIFVIGTPASLELNQTVTKGIISGTRKNQENVYIQIDASVNAGNSGGALVKKNGEFVGVINAKLFGVGVEGIGFSIPMQKVKEGLFLN